MGNPSNVRQALPRFELRVETGSSQDFELWRWAVSPMFSIDVPEADRAAFCMVTSGYHFADMAITTTRSSATRFDRSKSVIAKSGIDNIVVQIYVEGDYVLDDGGRRRLVEAGDVAVIDLVRPSVIEATRYTNVTLTLPRAALEPLVANLDDVHGLVLPKGSALNHLLASHMQSLLNEAPRLDLSVAAALVQATAGLVAACIGPAAGGEASANSHVSAASLRLIRQAIDANLADPDLGPELLAKRFGMSRAALYRLFAPLGGVRNYIQQRRLTRAYRAMSDPRLFGERIGTLAQHWGFPDTTVFSRAYRATYGLSPSDSRALAQQRYQDAARSRATAAGSFLALNRWLLGLEAQAEQASQ